MTAPATRTELRPDGVAVLTFDQPGSKANVLSPVLWTEFGAALDAARALPDLQGLVLASAKPGIFIAGADLNIIGAATAPNDPAVRDLIQLGLHVLDKLESFPVPTCAAIDGAALGGGLEVALACDFRIAGPHPKCSLGLPETTLGLIPGWGGTQRLPRIVGLPRAAEMLSTAKPIDASAAVDAGLVDGLFDAERLIDSAADIVLTRPYPLRRDRKRQPVPDVLRQQFQPAVADRPTAVRTALLVMMQGAELPLPDAIAVETRAFLQLAGSPESKAAIEAFFARKKA